MGELGEVELGEKEGKYVRKSNHKEENWEEYNRREKYNRKEKYDRKEKYNRKEKFNRKEKYNRRKEIIKSNRGKIHMIPTAMGIWKGSKAGSLLLLVGRNQ